MEVEPIRCAACGAALLGHWQCQICQCFGHANVQARSDKAVCTDCAKALARRGVRRCKGCGTIFPLVQAIKSKPYRCPACRTAIRRAQYLKHADAEKANTRRWSKANRAAIRARRRVQYATDPAYRMKMRGHQRASYARNRDARRARAKDNRAARTAITRRWKIANAERYRASERRWRIRRKLAILRGER